MKYSAVKYKKFTSQRRFGVELETGNTLTKAKVRGLLKKLSNHESFITKYQLSGESNQWHVKDDATCGPQGRYGPKGVEVASFVAKGVADLQHIAQVAEGLQKAGSKVNDNCGLHIHAEAKDLSVQQVGVIISYWIKIQDVFSMSLPVRRRDNPYCRNYINSESTKNWSKNEAAKSFFSAKTIWEIFKPTNLNFYDNEDRRVNLNLVNFARAINFNNDYRKTLELRWPEGTLDASDIKCWVRLFLSFIDTCKDLPMPTDLSQANVQETLTYLGLDHGPSTFIIFSEGLHETKTWFLERILKNADKKAAIKQALDILNLMWMPVKKYA